MVQQKESVLLNRWLTEFHRSDLQWTRVRLGIADNPKEAKFFQVTLRWADAVFINDGFVNIVESKLKPSPAALGQLEGYEKLFPVTPMFSTYKDWPIKLILLAPVLDFTTAEMASEKGITYEVWKPKDWDEKRRSILVFNFNIIKW